MMRAFRAKFFFEKLVVGVKSSPFPMVLPMPYFGVCSRFFIS